MPGPLGKNRTSVGKLRHRVRLQSPAETLSRFRDNVQAWADDTTLWARVVPWKGDEAMQSDRVQADVTHIVTMRHRTDVTAKKRLIWTGDAGDLVLNIVSVQPMTGDANYLDVWCRREG